MFSSNVQPEGNLAKLKLLPVGQVEDVVSLVDIHGCRIFTLPMA